LQSDFKLNIHKFIDSTQLAKISPFSGACYNLKPKTKLTVAFSANLAPSNNEIIPVNLVPLTWGITSKRYNSETSETFEINNAKLETVNTKKSFVKMYRNRCIVFVDGYYENNYASEKDRSLRSSFYVTFSNGKLMPIAAICEVDSLGNRSNFVFISIPGAPELSWLHKRMPLILQGPQEIHYWLNNVHLSEFVKEGEKVGRNLEWHQVSNKIFDPQEGNDPMLFHDLKT